MPTKHKDPAITIGLHVKRELSRDWFHLYAFPIIVGMNATQLNTVKNGGTLPARVDPDTVQYFDAYNTHGGLFFDGLRLSSQGTNSDHPRRLYAIEVCYRELVLTAENVERHAKTLTTIAARLAKQYKTLGNAIGFAQHAARFALAIGATRFAFDRTDEQRARMGSAFRITDIADGLYAIDQFEREWTAADEVAR